MMNIIGILREGLSKKGEKRVAVTPEYAKQIVEWKHKLIVQPAAHPETREIKRAYNDKEYKNAGTEISEDLSPADVIFGIKEIDTHRILPNKTYLLFLICKFPRYQYATHKVYFSNRFDKSPLTVLC